MQTQDEKILYSWDEK